MYNFTARACHQVVKELVNWKKTTFPKAAPSVAYAKSCKELKLAAGADGEYAIYPEGKGGAKMTACVGRGGNLHPGAGNLLDFVGSATHIRCTPCGPYGTATARAANQKREN